MFFLIHAHLRYADALRPLSEPALDADADGFGYIYTESSQAKNIKAKAFHGGTVPHVGHAIGITGQDWAMAWLHVRRSSGLCYHTQRTLHPLRDLAGHWSNLLQQHAVPNPQPVGTYSAKVSLLSWCAKHGGVSPTCFMESAEAASKPWIPCRYPHKRCYVFALVASRHARALGYPLSTCILFHKVGGCSSATSVPASL
eukprot:1972908-Amphidinium_carterae.2